MSRLSAARKLRVSGCEGEGDTTLFLVAGDVAAIGGDRALLPQWAEAARRKDCGLESLPDFIALQRDED